jgi:hypothetical protein
MSALLQRVNGGALREAPIDLSTLTPLADTASAPFTCTPGGVVTGTLIGLTGGAVIGDLTTGPFGLDFHPDTPPNPDPPNKDGSPTPHEIERDNEWNLGI